MTSLRRSLFRGACDILFPKEVDLQVADTFAWLEALPPSQAGGKQRRPRDRLWGPGWTGTQRPPELRNPEGRGQVLSSAAGS